MQTIANMMHRDVLSVTQDQTMREAIELFRIRRIRHLPVVEEGQLVGIVTDRDTKRATPSLLSEGGRDEYDRVLDTTRVSQIMTRDPITVTPQTLISDALDILIDRKVGALPVIEGSSLVGIVTDIDFLRAFKASLKG
ncbi:MAG TPA: CBS domain-containing protein [Thermoanaerobaculia bacterium]|nr:CBS domain-containing protein [Thermoanaerobaculia bacterium]